MINKVHAGIILLYHSSSRGIRSTDKSKVTSVNGCESEYVYNNESEYLNESGNICHSVNGVWEMHAMVEISACLSWPESAVVWLFVHVDVFFRIFCLNIYIFKYDSNLTNSNLDREQQSLEGNNVIRQLVSRIEQLSNAISPRHNQVEVESEVKRTFTSGNSSRTSQEASTSIDRPSRSLNALNERSTNRYRPVNLVNFIPEITWPFHSMQDEFLVGVRCRHLYCTAAKPNLA